VKKLGELYPSALKPHINRIGGLGDVYTGIRPTAHWIPLWALKAQTTGQLENRRGGRTLAKDSQRDKKKE
jgi:hypothetical protein